MCISYMPRSSAVITQTFACTKYGTIYCNGPNVSYGKKESSASIIALPDRKIGPAGAILNHFRPNSIASDIVTNVRDTVSSGMWENGSGTLTAFYTSSTLSGSSGAHYLDVYGTDPQSDSTAQAQFSIAYGDVHGSGSLGTKGVDGNRASAAIYRQLSNVLLGPTEEKFTFAGSGGNITPNFIYAISDHNFFKKFIYQ